MLTGKSYFSRKALKDNLDEHRDSYDFIDDIMEDESISIRERERFWNEFAHLYIQSSEFRHLTHGKYILFVKDIYEGIVNSREEAKTLFPCKGRILTYIGDDGIRGRVYNYGLVNHITDGDDRGVYKFNMNIKFKCGFRYQETYTLDTGCTDSNCFLVNNWDNKNKIFRKIKRDGIPQEVFDELNGRNDDLVRITMGGVSSENKYYRMSLDPPLLVNLENLSEVPIKFILVPKFDHQYDEERLLGTDFMFDNYTFKFSSFNGEYGFKITDLENEK